MAVGEVVEELLAGLVELVGVLALLDDVLELVDAGELVTGWLLLEDEEVLVGFDCCELEDWELLVVLAGEVVVGLALLLVLVLLVVVADCALLAVVELVLALEEVTAVCFAEELVFAVLLLVVVDVV